MNTATLVVVLSAIALTWTPGCSGRRGRCQVLCELKSSEGRFLVAQQSDMPVGWDVALYWKRTGQPWAAYYLEHEARSWSQVQLVAEKNHILVNRGGKVAADLDLAKYSLYNYHQNFTHQKPMFVVLDRNPFTRNRAALVYPDSSAWTSVWPRAEAAVPDDFDALHKR
jgi:hypothetical protein